MILLAGDFRQTLPVIPRSTAADELNACLKSSIWWRYVRKLTLTTNVCVQLQNDLSAAEFSKQLLDICNGIMPLDSEGRITLQNNFYCSVNSKNELIQSVFPSIKKNYKNHTFGRVNVQ